MEPLIIDSARVHGVSDEDMLHAIRNHIDEFDVGDGMTMIVGPSYSARLLEIGLVESSNEDRLVIVHAMSARKKFLR